MKKENDLKLAVVTPVYNDDTLLFRLFESLERSESKAFTWIIINDGSTDGTEAVMNTIQERASFKVRTRSRKNGGKCSALNVAFEENPDFDFYVVIDSDTEVLADAIKRLRDKVRQYQEDETVGAIYCWRNMKNDPVLQRKLPNRPKEDRLLTVYEKRASKGLFGDGVTGYYKRFISKYRFREFPGEKFIGEGTILLRAAMKGYAARIVYVDIVMSEGEYSATGLTAQGRAMRLRNPYGMIYYSGMMQSKLLPDWRMRCKYAVGAQAYASVSKISKKDLVRENIDSNYLKAWAKLPGMLLGIYWKLKYIGP